ncbi:hypothetical protein AY599_18595 [Leptolyngbya valderiana BDU 20041]|nr:hypothetical protein AY599_18595 [Leptolyngbya valderiana BDU 20041]
MAGSLPTASIEPSLWRAYQAAACENGSVRNRQLVPSKISPVGNSSFAANSFQGPTARWDGAWEDGGRPSRNKTHGERLVRRGCSISVVDFIGGLFADQPPK